MFLPRRVALLRVHSRWPASGRCSTMTTHGVLELPIACLLAIHHSSGIDRGAVSDSNSMSAKWLTAVLQASTGRKGHMPVVAQWTRRAFTVCPRVIDGAAEGGPHLQQRLLLQPLGAYREVVTRDCPVVFDVFAA